MGKKKTSREAVPAAEGLSPSAIASNAAVAPAGIATAPQGASGVSAGAVTAYKAAAAEGLAASSAFAACAVEAGVAAAAEAAARRRPRSGGWS